MATIVITHYAALINNLFILNQQYFLLEEKALVLERISVSEDILCLIEELKKCIMEQ